MTSRFFFFCYQVYMCAYLPILREYKYHLLTMQEERYRVFKMPIRFHLCSKIHFRGRQRETSRIKISLRIHYWRGGIFIYFFFYRRPREEGINALRPNVLTGPLAINTTAKWPLAVIWMSNITGIKEGRVMGTRPRGNEVRVPTGRRDHHKAPYYGLATAHR